MINILRIFIRNHYLSRWIILLLDLSIIATTYIFTWLIYYVLRDIPFDYQSVLVQMMSGLPLFLFAAYLFKPHHGVIRHTALNDALTLLKCHLLASAGLILLSWGALFFPMLRIHWAVIVTHFFISVLSLISFRLLVRYFYMILLNVEKDKNSKNVMIFGAGELGIITSNSMKSDRCLTIKAVGFIDDNSSMRGKILNGIKVFSQEEAFAWVIKKQNVEEIIMAVSPGKISRERKAAIADLCIRHNIRITEIPAPWQWINGSFSVNQLHNINIEDLLGRDTIRLETEEVKQGVLDKRVMVTGAAGSIGSEIVRQLARLQPAELILLDNAESPLYDLYHDLLRLGCKLSVQQILADVSDKSRMDRVFALYQPEIVFHASAYKHVPMIEDQPYEAVKNNIRGTKIVADLALENGVEKFVMVSTDKAVNPTNVMGASKRICEIYIQALSETRGVQTRFITTRFGNVLGSNGSVIPLFEKQIAHGGPVTITHRDIVRYFMTIPEAAQLVLEAGFMGQGGEIFVFDMGQPVRIFDLAEKMIALSGLKPQTDIQIIETGLRPGEKLYEELLADLEHTLPTHNNKILIARIRNKDYKTAKYMIDALVKQLPDLTDQEIVKMMKKIVPAYISNNSVFEVLDDQKEDENIQERFATKK